MTDHMSVPIENLSPNTDSTIPIMEMSCDQNNLSQPDLSPLLSHGYAHNANMDDINHRVIGIRSQKASPNVATVKNRDKIPAAKRDKIPKTPIIRAHQGARVIRISLISLGI